jgi:hypothetical protein
LLQVARRLLVRLGWHSFLTAAAAAAAGLLATGGKAPAGASRLALALNGSETDEQLAAIKSVDAAVALLDTPVSEQLYYEQ